MANDVVTREECRYMHSSMVEERNIQRQEDNRRLEIIQKDVKSVLATIIDAMNKVNNVEKVVETHLEGHTAFRIKLSVALLSCFVTFAFGLFSAILLFRLLGKA